jgi:hypothetical protein
MSSLFGSIRFQIAIKSTPLDSMLSNGVDEFRKKFFADFVQAEKDKEIALKRLQRNCFHTFHIVDGNIECNKCGIYKKPPTNPLTCYAVKNAQ